MLRVLAVALLVAGVGCSESPTAVETSELLRARARWARTAPDAYQITVRLGCFCPPEVTRPVVVTVRNGQVESRRYADTGVDVSPTFASLFPTVDGLFELIADALESKADYLNATYDPTRGFPVSIAIDPKFGWADEESYYATSDFAVR